MILDAAIPFLAEAGFSGQTRLLAQSLGISHSVLYRHFPTKELLIQAVCTEMFERRWQPAWAAVLHDASLPLEKRLLHFYRAAGALLLAPEWVRIALAAGLTGQAKSSGLRSLLEDRVVHPVAETLRTPRGSGAALTEPEAREQAWALQGRVFYLGARLAVWRGATPRDPDAALSAAIAGFCRGARALAAAEA
ncbi:TetR/AcrR family transcriptional regulator [Roseomonas populi]|uniref:TetR/AcrR family transcriptional regulator n=1 Tax=Roseomonas populi TaxID=3121582 RepID=A0ABT1XA32_9PROT|nr:TetR/AcrR family transcriptional regulator [Roseomonas pecuniae]MCR0983839.1 TetR/AcrR family transcriptional regulator [Roseomonas pecuniae]